MQHEKEKRKTGGRRPTVLTDEQIAQVEALAAVLSLEQIADYFGVSKVTFYAIMDRQPLVSLRYKAGKSKAIASVATGLLQKARSGDTASAVFYLKTQARWRETTHLDHTSSDGSMGDRKMSEAVLKALESKYSADSEKDS